MADRPRLLLVGFGHAHLFVLDALARAPLQAQVTLITPYERQFYSGMLPGWIAGHYRSEQCAIRLRPAGAARRRAMGPGAGHRPAGRAPAAVHRTRPA